MKVLKGFFEFFHTKLLNFGRATARDRAQNIPFLLRIYLPEIVFLLASIGLFAIIFVPTLGEQMNAWMTVTPRLSIPAENWRAVYLEGPGQHAIFLTPDSLGHPKNKILWQSHNRLNDKDYGNRVKDMVGKKFWIGTILESATLKEASSKLASVLMLGFFNSSYQIYVDGVLAGKGTGKEDEPSSVQIPFDLISKGHPIKIAILVNHDLNAHFPIWFDGKNQGLYTFSDSVKQREYWKLIGSYKFLLTAGWALLLAFLSFSLWLSVPKKTEYFYYGLYLFIFFLIEIFLFGAIRASMDRAVMHPIKYFLRIGEGCVAALLGASFARVQKTVTASIFLISLTVGLLGYIGSKSTLSLNLIDHANAQFYVPTMFLIGALLCFGQAMLIWREQPQFTNLKAVKLRTRRLTVFGVILIALGTIYLMQANNFKLIQSVESFFRPVQLIILLAMGFFIFFDYREREFIFSQTRTSPYHDVHFSASPPVKGIILAIDLKKSSILMNYAAEHNLKMKPVTRWNNFIGNFLNQNGGYKISDEGDGFKILFERSNTPPSFERILHLLVEIAHITSGLEEKFKAEGLIPKDFKFRFRSALLWGSIQPIWKDFGGFKSPEWEDATGCTTFKDIQRLIDTEKNLDFKNADSSVVLTSNFEVKSQDFNLAVKEVNVKDVGTIRIQYGPLELKTKSQTA